MLVLGIESSCDETAAALVREDGTVVSDVVASQVGVHAPYGGVVPELAARAQRLVGRQAFVEDWTREREGAVYTQHTITVILEIFGVLLLLAGGAVLGTLVGGRMVAQERAVGVLKTAGAPKSP